MRNEEGGGGCVVCGARTSILGEKGWWMVDGVSEMGRLGLNDYFCLYRKSRSSKWCLDGRGLLMLLWRRGC